jgi:hypothetical protein
MQGIESLDNFKSFVSSLGGLGRFEDTYIVHAAEGETVVPMEVLDRNPALKPCNRTTRILSQEDCITN